MKNLPRTLLLVLAVALLAAPAAGARDRDTDRKPSVAPLHRAGGMTGGELLGEVWVQEFERPAGESPFVGGCIPVAGHVVVAVTREDGTARCTATRRTQLFVYFGTACTEIEKPFPKTEEEQRACAVAFDRAIEAINITVDEGRTVNIVKRRFELFSPQRTAQVPAGKFEEGAPARPVTLTAHAWGAVIRRLRPGRHTVEVQFVVPSLFEQPFTATVTLDVTRRRPAEEEQGERGLTA